MSQINKLITERTFQNIQPQRDKWQNIHTKFTKSHQSLRLRYPSLSRTFLFHRHKTVVLSLSLSLSLSPVPQNHQRYLASTNKTTLAQTFLGSLPSNLIKKQPRFTTHSYNNITKKDRKKNHNQT